MNKNGRYPEAYMGAVHMQRLFLQAVLDPSVSLDVKAKLATVYSTLEEMKRKLAMRPLPKPIDVGRKPKQTVEAATFSEPVPTILTIENSSDIVAVEPPQNKKP